jgi:tyrosinase
MYPHSFSRSAFLVLHWLLTFVAATEPLFYDAWLEERAQSGENVVLPLEPRQIYDGSYPVTGVQNAGIKPRLEIRELQKNADMFNIYILGLRRFQDTPQDQRNSYYDICGECDARIHSHAPFLS